MTASLRLRAPPAHRRLASPCPRGPSYRRPESLPAPVGPPTRRLARAPLPLLAAPGYGRPSLMRRRGMASLSGVRDRWVVRVAVLVDGVAVRHLDPATTPYRGCAAPVRGCTRAFSLVFPDANLFGIPAGTYAPAVADGYYLLLLPLRPGPHTIAFGGTGNFSGTDVPGHHLPPARRALSSVHRDSSPPSTVSASPGDERRRVRAQPRDRAGDLARAAHAPHRHVAGQRLAEAGEALERRRPSSACRSRPGTPR